MLRFIAKRLASTLLIIVALILILLILSQLSPVNPGRVALGPQATAEAIEAYNDKIGFNDPLPMRFTRYVSGLLSGDLGVSVRTQQPVARDLEALWPATLELALAGLAMAGLLGLLFGGLGAVRGSRAYALRGVMTFLGSAPSFLLAFALLIIFAQQLRWLPLAGRTSYGDAPIGPTGFLTIDAAVAGRPDVWIDAVAHLILPAFCIAAVAAVAIGRVLRGSLRAVLGTNYISSARTKGLSDLTVFRRHALRNAAGPALSVAGLQFGLMLSGVIIVEQIFGWPGVGIYLAEAIPANDFPAVAAITLVLGVAYVLINMLVDLIQAWADPRITSEA